MNYSPISCSYHDLILHKATLKHTCEVVYTDSNGAVKAAQATIKDVFTRKSEEFMLLSNGLEIRLDHIISLDGDFLPPEGGMHCSPST